MKNPLDKTSLLLRFAPEVGGVFSLSELSSLFDIANQQTLWIAVREFDSQILSAKVRTDSYISFGSALAYRRLIGTESPRLVTCVTPARAAEYSGDVNLSYARISKDLFFGYETLQNGVKMADAEKAVLDTLYFYQHKKTFYFNIFQDIDFSTLSRKKLDAYLKQYKNPKFQTFARNTIDGKV